jgi:hypothetical protein
MTARIELKRETAKTLEQLKQKYGAGSMDGTIRRLIRKAEGASDSMFGGHPEMTRFLPSDEASSHET